MTGDCPLAWGTIGWEDESQFYSTDDSAADGNLLVNVQLFRGRDQGKAFNQSIAQGQKLISKLASNFIAVPPKGTRVLVAIPEPFGITPGGSVIIACDNPNPVAIGNLKPGESGVLAALGAARILLKANGAIVLYTTSDNTSSGTGCSVYCGPDKIQLGNQHGAITIDGNGITLTAAGGGGLAVTPAGKTTLSGTEVSVLGSIAAISGTIATMLGPNATPTPLSAAAYSPTGPVNLVSTTVFVSP